jgi:hypothetical protein
VLASRVRAHVLVIYDIPHQDRSDDALKACENAENCEIYESGQGKRIRFVKGMEPGTEHYKRAVLEEVELTKRGKSEVVMRITYGKNSLIMEMSERVSFFGPNQMRSS